MRLAPCDSIVPMEGRREFSVVWPSRHLDSNRLALSVRCAIMRARTWLLAQQHESGRWVGCREGNPSTESETILLLAFFGREQDDLASRCARHLIEKQRDEGGWSAYPGGEVEISISVKAYFALKLIGEDPSTEPMQRARRAILAHGGADSVDGLTRFFLAILGQIPHDICPTVPPEFEPLSIVASRRPVQPIDPRRGIRELFFRKPEEWPSVECLTVCENHTSGDDHASIVWSLIGLKCLDSTNDSPEVQRRFEQIDALMLDDESTGSTRLQPSTSPVRDTAVSIRALGASGTSFDNRAMCRAVDWLLDRNDASHFDSFETATFLAALGSQFASDEPDDRLPPEFHLIDQESDGSMDDPQQQVTRADRVTKAVQTGLHHLSISRHTSSAELTGLVLESLGLLGQRQDDSDVEGAIAYLIAAQQPDGSWSGDRGVHYIHGTSQVVRGLAAVGVSSDAPVMAAGVNWLLAHQQPCGGWGESPDACHEPSQRGQGTPTASQTAWALMGLLNAGAGLDAHPAVARGVQFLIDRQRADGTWDEPEFTASGDSGAFYFRNELDSICFPLLALSRWAVSESAAMVEEVPPVLRVVHPEEDECWGPRLATVSC